MRRRSLTILVVLLTLALGRVIHKPIFSTAPAAESVAIGKSQKEAIKQIVFPTTQNDNQWLEWLAFTPPANLGDAPAAAATQPVDAVISSNPIMWNFITQTPTFIVSPSQPGWTRRDPLNDPISLVEDISNRPAPSDDIEGLSSGEGSSGTTHKASVPFVAAEAEALPTSAPPALTLSGLFPGSTSNNPASPGVGAIAPTPEPSGMILLAAIVFTTETRRARRKKTKI